MNLHMTPITPVFLAGGSGTRLWPLSRRNFPKQFSSVIGNTTLFQNTALCMRHSETITFAKPITITHDDFRFIVIRQLLDVGVDPGPILTEPVGKNTGPAILVAALYADANGTNPILLVSPCDQLISDQHAFLLAVNQGLPLVEKGEFVTFGIQPNRAETGYGYLELKSIDNEGASKVINFIEKPDATTAQSLINTGKYLWNSGIFLCRARDIISAFETYAPQILEQVKSSLKKVDKDFYFYRLGHDLWARCQNISIDNAIMEKTNNLVAIPLSAGWSDIGCWNSVWEVSESDNNGVVSAENTTSIDCKNVLLKSDQISQHLVGLGLDDIIAVAMPDAVLVAHKDRAQDVRDVVENLKLNHVAQAEVFPIDYRPWGCFEALTKAERFQVKRILVHPGAALSLQSHNYRSEHWIVVQGTAKVTIDDEVTRIFEGQSIYIPLGAQHRLENPGKTQLILIEVQIGGYLGEDDITRHHDIYSRT